MTDKPFGDLFLDARPVSCINGTTDCYESIEEAIEEDHLEPGDLLKLTPYRRLPTIVVRVTEAGWEFVK